MKISPVSPIRTKLLKTFVLSVAFGMVSCGLEDNLSEIAPEGDTGDATGGKSTGGAPSTQKSGAGGSSKSSYATGGKASASAGGSDSNSGVGGAKATGKSSTTRGSASAGGAKATGSGGASNADDTDGESGSNASPKGGSNGQRSSTTRTSKAGAGGTGTVSVPMGGARSNSVGGAGNTSSNGGTKATSSGGSGNTGNSGASTGGSRAATGGAATGGSKAATGGAATGGSKAATGGVATGGVATGGVATGGVATGGKPATGGAATGGAPTTTSAPPITGSCSEGQKSLTANGTGTHCGYTYEYWKDQGTGTLTLKADGFSVDWSNINNLLGRKGIRPGTGNEVVTYSATYNPNGNSYLCIYGWFKNPLVEYYIVDSWGTWRPPGGQGLQGTVTCDGATYDIYKLPRTGPSIEGDNTSFTQYFNVRQQKRTSGTINVGCHIASWKAKGMSVGSFYEVSMTVEGYQSSGTADVKFSMK